MDKYLEWVPRVSNIVEFKYPFDINSQARFMTWLANLNINEEEYMNIAQSWWTEIHLTMENYMNWIEYISPLLAEVENEINNWIKWIDNLKSKYSWINYLTECYVRDEHLRFNWTIDLIRVNEKTKEVWLYDYKSRWVAKKKYWLSDKLLKSWAPIKPTEKLKKLSLQLSLYALVYEQRWYKIMWLYWVWLHNTWCYEYEVERWSKWELDKLLSEYFLSKNTDMENTEVSINIENPLVISLQTAPIAFAAIKVELDLWKLKEWADYKKAINEAVAVHKRLHSLYIPEWK